MSRLWSLGNKNTVVDKIELSLPTISCEEVDHSYSSYGMVKVFKAAYAHEIGIALFNKLSKQEVEIKKLQQTIDQQEKIVVSLKAEIGDMIRKQTVNEATKYVDFAEAWKAYDNGKRIRSVASECEWLKSTVGSAYHSFSTTEIRGKWVILEDE